MIDRKSVRADSNGKASRFNLLLRAVVAGLAERLERTNPEPRRVATMRRDVVTDRGPNNLPCLKMECAQRIGVELILAYLTPTCGRVPLLPRLRRCGCNVLPIPDPAI